MGYRVVDTAFLKTHSLNSALTLASLCICSFPLSLVLPGVWLGHLGSASLSGQTFKSSIPWRNTPCFPNNDMVVPPTARVWPAPTQSYTVSANCASRGRSLNSTGRTTHSFQLKRINCTDLQQCVCRLDVAVTGLHSLPFFLNLFYCAFANMRRLFGYTIVCL